jgi:MFS transporter, AAHS family, 4-hydroxybenzoate transporter
MRRCKYALRSTRYLAIDVSLGRGIVKPEHVLKSSEAESRRLPNSAPLRVASLCAFVAFCDGFDAQAIAYVAPVISKQWGVLPAQFGPVFSAGLVGLALGALLFGSLADRIGRKPVILLCVALFGLSSILTTWSSSMAELAVWRVVTGLGLGGVLPNLIATTNEVAPASRKNLFVMMMFCGFPLGATIGGLASAPLIAASGWHSIFIVGGVLPLAVLPLLYLYLPQSANSPKPQPSDGLLSANTIAQLFQDGRAIPTLLLWAAFFSNLLVMYFLVNWLPSMLTIAGSSLSVATLSTALLNLGGIFGAIVLARLINGPHAVQILACGYVAAAAVLFLIARADGNVPVLLVGAALAGAVIVGGQIAMNAIVASFYPNQIRSTALGAALGVGRIGSIIGPLLGGLLLTAGWQGTSAVILAIIPTLIAACALFGVRRFVEEAHANKISHRSRI